MAEFLAGPTMVMTWTYSGGTINLAADYRTCTFSQTVGFEDITAGSDTHIGRIPTLKDATAQIELLAQTGGTAIQAALQAGVPGTLVIQPEGTAANKRKITFPAYCDGAVPQFPYANAVVMTCGFTSGGGVLGFPTDSTN